VRFLVSAKLSAMRFLVPATPSTVRFLVSARLSAVRFLVHFYGYDMCVSHVSPLIDWFLCNVV
jgi:hypothetical protein